LQSSGELLHAIVPVGAAAWETAGAVAVDEDDKETEDANCGTACVKPAIESMTVGTAKKKECIVIEIPGFEVEENEWRDE
jgi:hypothetical protein